MHVNKGLQVGCDQGFKSPIGDVGSERFEKYIYLKSLSKGQKKVYTVYMSNYSIINYKHSSFYINRLLSVLRRNSFT